MCPYLAVLIVVLVPLSPELSMSILQSRREEIDQDEILNKYKYEVVNGSSSPYCFCCCCCCYCSCFDFACCLLLCVCACVCLEGSSVWMVYFPSFLY